MKYCILCKIAIEFFPIAIFLSLKFCNLKIVQKIKVILANTKMKSIKTVADFDTNPVDSTQ